MYSSKTVRNIVRKEEKVSFGRIRDSFFKLKETLLLVYLSFFKGKRILVHYTRMHPYIVNIAKSPPRGIIFIGPFFHIKNDVFINLFCNKIDIIHQDGNAQPNDICPLSLRENAKVIKEFEAPYYKKALKDKRVKKIITQSKWAKGSETEENMDVEVLYTAPPQVKGFRRRKEKEEKKKFIGIFLCVYCYSECCH